ncbi:MAG: KOW domain-containing RNA-binding protein [Oscillospiraceae bacterium]|nr:KOW domain-containing RNA-binding protein [Oscillospiraceae bacterium]
MEIRTSHVVLSTAGHDKGQLFLVVGEAERFLLLADGKTRTFGKPKRKNRRHVRFAAASSHPAAAFLQGGGQVENSEIRKALAAARGAARANLGEASTLG